MSSDTSVGTGTLCKETNHKRGFKSNQISLFGTWQSPCWEGKFDGLWGFYSGFQKQKSAPAHKVKMHQCSFTSSVNETFEPYFFLHLQATLGSWLWEVMVFLPGLSAPSPLAVLVPLEGLGWIEKGYIGGSSAGAQNGWGTVPAISCSVIATEQKMSWEGEKNQWAWINFIQPSNMPW